MTESGSPDGLWLLPMEFTVRELDELELPIEASDDPDELVFVLGQSGSKTLVCPTAFDRTTDSGG